MTSPRRNLIGWYVNVRDGGRNVQVLGPLKSEAIARRWAYRDKAQGGNAIKHSLLRKATERVDPKAAFYEFGLAKVTAPDLRVGLLNTEIVRAWKQYRWDRAHPYHSFYRQP